MAQFTSPTTSAAVFAAGPYNVTYTGPAGGTPVKMGFLRGSDQSPFLEIMRRSQLINRTHLYGETPIGAVGLGGEAFANLVMMEYLTAVNALIWPYPIAGAGSYFGAVPDVGFEDYNSVAGSLIFTATALTMAIPASSQSITAAKAVIQEDFGIQKRLGPILRETPLRFRLFPASSSSMYFWTVA